MAALETMELVPTETTPKQFGRSVSIGIVGVAVLLGLVVLYHAGHSPRTDDAEVFANFIGIAPQVEGPIIHLNVRDNQFVNKGELLYEIDEQPYEYAVERALSEQAALEGQINDEQRRINALVSGVSVAKANVLTSQADVSRWAAAVEQARADVASAEQGVSRVKAEWTYASNNLHRLEPLLAKQFVTVDQVDRARTSEIAQAEALKQAESQLRLRVMTNYTAAARFGYLLIITIPLWDRHVSGNERVEGTLWAFGTISIASVITGLLELVYAEFIEHDDLLESIGRRLAAIEQVLDCYISQGAVGNETEQKITNLAILGTSGMRRNLERSS